jgi:phage-related protein
MLLRLLQEGEQLGMPQAEALPDVGPRCGALRVRDAEQNWRILYRIEADAVLVIDVFSKKTRKLPKEIIERCRRRLKQFDAITSQAQKRSTMGKPRED